MADILTPDIKTYLDKNKDQKRPNSSVYLAQQRDQEEEYISYIKYGPFKVHLIFIGFEEGTMVSSYASGNLAREELNLLAKLIGTDASAAKADGDNKESFRINLFEPEADESDTLMGPQDM